MARTETCWQKIVDTLKAEMTPIGKLNYIKSLFEGVRDDIPESAFPAIVLEPASETETRHNIPRQIKNVLRIYIYCFLQVYDIETQITGQEGRDKKGIFDIVTDVKNVLMSNISLDNNALRINFPITTYTFTFFPYRTAEITVEIEFTSLDTER